MRWLLLLVLASPAQAADVKYVWTNPAFQQLSDSCGADSSKPESGLAQVDMWLWRGDTGETLSLGTKPIAGHEGREDSVLVSVADSVWYHAFIVRAVDAAGNESCTRSYLDATPVSEWPPAVPTRPPGLLAQAWDNTDFTGGTVTQVDAQVDWTCGAWPLSVAPIPGGTIGSGYFSVRWTGYVTLSAPGMWAFCTDTDDGARLWIDGRLLVDSWATSGRLKACGSSDFAAGAYSIRMEYRQSGGTCLARLLWSPPGSAESTVPAAALSH